MAKMTQQQPTSTQNLWGDQQRFLNCVRKGMQPAWRWIHLHRPTIVKENTNAYLREEKPKLCVSVGWPPPLPPCGDWMCSLHGVCVWSKDWESCQPHDCPCIRYPRVITAQPIPAELKMVGGWDKEGWIRQKGWLTARWFTTRHLVVPQWPLRVRHPPLNLRKSCPFHYCCIDIAGCGSFN